MPTERLIQYIFGGISGFSSLVVIFLFLCSSSRTMFSFEMIFYLTLASLLTNISYVINYVDLSAYSSREEYEKEPICIVQSFLILVSELSVTILSTLITMHCYVSTKKYDVSAKLEEKKNVARLIVLCVGLGLPVIISLISYFVGSFGVTQIWCWIKEDSEGSQLCFLIFIWCLVIINSVLAYLTFKELGFNYSSEDKNDNMVYSQEYVRVLIGYPIVCYLTWFIGTVDRLNYLYGNKEWERFFFILTIIAFQLQGFLYAMILLFKNVDRLKETAKVFYKMAKYRLFCGCCRRKRNSLDDEPRDLYNFIILDSDKQVPQIDNDNDSDNDKNEIKDGKDEVKKEYS